MLLVAVSPATAWMARDMLTVNRSFPTAIASAAIAVMVSVITAAPLAEDLPISIAAPSSEPIVELSDATPVRLVVGKPAPGAADNPIPISISLINAAVDDVVFLSGLPSGSTMTNGRPSANGGWQLLARELADAAVRPAQGFVGGADVTVELRNVDQSVIDRQELHLEWAGPAPPATTPATTDVALTAAPPAAPIPDAVTEHDEAIFRAFLQSRGNATPETRGTARPPRAADVRITVSGPHVRGQTAASGPHLLAVPLAGGAVRPRQPMVWRADFGDRQKKPAPKSSLPASRRERPPAPSASP
jgi:hypothetical protein